MKITRKIDKESAKYDILELTHTQFIQLLNAYEKQMYIYCNRYPDDTADELLGKLRSMANKEEITV